MKIEMVEVWCSSTDVPTGPIGRIWVRISAARSLSASSLSAA
ncbi:hypothetical protein QWZ10_23435 [Paracoccus cavernae]|uniref:Uncharacterized protein n=1 Tax=Paracoccus cavernae TaxID=1571207 RepID=A0ABT8DBB5_9RHOB|nr:hypothetical protein [Paracoccus cavernae]